MPDYEYLVEDSLQRLYSSPWDQYREVITSVVIGNDVEKIGKYAFIHCENLTSVTIGRSVTIIGEQAFQFCFALTEIVNYQEVPQMIEEISNMRIRYGQFGQVFKPNCSLFVPAGSLEAYRAADVWKDFYKMGIIGDPGSITIRGEAKQLKWTLSDSGVLTVSGTGDMWDYPGMGQSDPPWIYYQNSIIHAVIDEGVTRIGFWAFYSHSDLISITIGNSVTSIGSAAFAGCVGLTEIINNSVVPQKLDHENVFDYQTKSASTLFVPAESVVAYHTAVGWRDFVNIRPIQ